MPFHPTIGSCCTPSRTVRRAPTGSFGTRSGRCSASRAACRRRWARALLDTLEQSAPDLLPLAPLLADVAQVDVPATPEADRIDPQFRADRVADVLIELTGRLLAQAVVMLVEDAHWADGASAHLLDRVAVAATGRPWAVITCTAGRGAGSPRRGSTSPSRPAAAHGRRAARHRRHGGHPAAAARDRSRRGGAEGNPLFVEEVTRLSLGAGPSSSPRSRSAPP